METLAHKMHLHHHHHHHEHKNNDRDKDKDKDLYVDVEPVPEIMATPPSPTSKSQRESRDTGFPEPFCGSYNTTLPYPGADLSPNAVLTGDSLSPEGAMRRRRLSMLQKHRRTVSQSSSNSNSSLNAPSNALYSVLGAIQSQIPGVSPSARPTSSAQDSIEEEPRDQAMEDEEQMTPSPQSAKRGIFGWRKGRN